MKQNLKDLLKTALVALAVVVLFNAAFGKKCTCNTTVASVTDTTHVLVDTVK